MHKRGFEKTESSWLKDQYLVTDITGSNVVVTHNDYAIVVDADVNYREPSFFGEQHLTENQATTYPDKNNGIKTMK